MPAVLDKPLNGTLLACLEYYRVNPDPRTRRTQLYNTLKTSLSDFLSGMAQVQRTNYSGWEIDNEHPGYLIKVEGSMVARVPYHVLPTFPTDVALQAAWYLSRAVRSADDSIICLSGSNVLRRIFEIVGDEYLKLPGKNTRTKLDSNLQGNDDLVCLRVAVGADKWEYPWRPGKVTGSILARKLNPNSDENCKMKFDYAGAVDTIGVTDISNIIVAIDKAGNSLGLKKTFPPQEAPLGAIDVLPNQMADPWEMGRYIEWLVDSILSYRDSGDMCKCLKRCASLSRVLFLPDVTDRIVKLARQTRVLLERRIDDLGELETNLSALTDDRSKKLLSALRTQLDQMRRGLRSGGGPTTVFEKRRFAAEVKKIVRLLLSAISPNSTSRSAA
jgi:hypothetical protein